LSNSLKSPAEHSCCEKNGPDGRDQLSNIH
jgi:hypothetical protein